MRYYVVVVALLVVIPSFSQERCGFDQRLDQQILHNPSLLEELSERDQHWSQIQHARRQENNQYMVPVVVHIVHEGEPLGAGSNISDAQVFSAIDQLNQAFAGDGRFTTPNSNIQFSMAARTPDCQSTSGIVRVDGSSLCSNGDCYGTVGLTSNNERTIKSASRWPSLDYLNIWVVSAIDGQTDASGVQGFAQFPGGESELDGIVILHKAFGYDPTGKRGFNLNPSTKLGTILVHEVGHSLGLYHSFEGDDYNRDGYGDRCPSVDGCGLFNGDCIDDTPPHRRSNGSCRTNDRNICDGGGASSLYIHNFMDYSGESCQTEFTPGQVDRMRTVLSTSREGWANSIADLPIIYSTAQAGSCNPQTRNLTNSFGLGMILFQMGDFARHSGNAIEDGGYVDDWCSSANVKSGHSYPMNVVSGSSNRQNVSVYCDYNSDGVFDEGTEKLMQSERALIHQTSVTIPKSAKKNTPLRLRIISTYAGFKINSACHQPYFGQVEDYAIVVDGIASPEVISFSSQGSAVTWEIAGDHLNSTYTLQWSDGYDGNFTGLATFDAKQVDKARYAFDMLTHNLNAKLLRIQIIGNDGNISYSETIPADRVSPLNDEIQLFPNPNATSAIQLRLSKDFQGVVHQIELFDQGGGMVKKFAKPIAQGEVIVLDMDDIQPGTYFIKLISDQKVLVKKLSQL